MASTIRRSLLPRQVHVQISAAPETLTQSRMVLSALQRFGEVSTYLNLRYDTKSRIQDPARTALVIFDTSHAASNAISASPIMIPFPPDNHAHASGAEHGYDHRQGNNGSTSKSPHSRRRSASTNTATITLKITPSDHNHTTHARQNPYYNSFPLATRSPGFQHLVRTGAAVSAPTPMHADCITRLKRLPPQREQLKILRRLEEEGARSLMGMWRRGRERQGREEKERKETGEVESEMARSSDR